MIKIKYEGGLRTQAVHLRSANELITDAPIDNNGKGEAFSPTDLVATSLASCQMTIMGIVSERNGIQLDGLEADVEKIMTDNPRRIAKIKISYTIPSTLKLSKEQHDKLHRAALTCPVGLSLNPEITQEVIWNNI